MSVSSEQAVAVLEQHQHEYRGCKCGSKWPNAAYLVVEQDTWLAEHQVAELAKAGIFPFRVPSSP